MENIMEYKEVMQECFEELESVLNREPTWKEVEELFLSRAEDIKSCYRE